MKPTKLTPRFERALAMAHRLHKRQTRKSTGIPYISHLLAVCSLVLEDGGNENEAIAALLHDAAEDQGGISTLKRIKKAFGPTVADLVAGCSDTFQTPKPPWKARKVAYLNHLAKASPSIQCIVAADKLDFRAIPGELSTPVAPGAPSSACPCLDMAVCMCRGDKFVPAASVPFSPIRSPDGSYGGWKAVGGTMQSPQSVTATAAVRFAEERLAPGETLLTPVDSSQGPSAGPGATNMVRAE